MFTTVIFDLDGTLLNTVSDLAAAGNHSLSAMGFPQHPTETFRGMIGNGIPKLVSRMLPLANKGPATQELALSLFMKYYSEHSCDYTAPYAGIANLLHTLKINSVQLGILSNKSDSLVPPIVEHYFPNVFDACMGLPSHVPAKPDPSCALALLQLLNADAQHTLLVGDSDVDMETALRAGLTPCGVLWGMHCEERLRQSGAQYLVTHPDELLGIVLPNQQK